MFGRRKNGFSTEIIVTEYEDEVNEDKIKENEERIDLVEFLNEGEGEEIESLKEVEIEEKSKVELLADFIRGRSAAAFLTRKSSLYEDDEEIEETLELLLEDETFKDITSIEGKEELYYYSNKVMSDNYAMIAMLVEDRDLSRVIAEMVRWNSKTYPSPTPISYFGNSPYNYSREELEVALKNIKLTDKYSDIGELTTTTKKRFLFSTLHMSEKYARGLAEDAEHSQG